MNERIKELYTKATAWALHNYPPPVNTFEWEDLRNNKFAELIVKECYDVVINDGRFHDAKGILKIGKHVAMQNFGVEE